MISHEFNAYYAYVNFVFLISKKTNNLIMNKCLCIIVFAVSLHFSVDAQMNAPIVPDSMFSYSFTNTGLNENGMLLSSPIKLNSQPNSPGYVSPYPLMTDDQGYSVWFSKKPVAMTLDFKYHKNENIYSYTTIIGGPKVVILNDKLEIIDTISTTNTSGEVHDFQRMQNGNWLLMTHRLDTMDLSAFTFDSIQGSDTTVIVGIGMQEIDEDNNVIFTWNSNDHLHPTEAYDEYGYTAANFDYSHANAVEEDTDGHILMSIRHMNSIYKIHRVTGETIWRLGGKSSDFTFVNDNGFSGQHDIRRMSNGNYSLFDNANTASEPKITRGVEYVLDTINWTATKVFEFIHPNPFFARAMGSYRVLDNGIGVLGYGFIFRPFPSATIFDHASKNILAEMYFQDKIVSYRALYYPNLTLPQPEITCKKINDKWVLSGPDTASVFLWSTGEKTAAIEIIEPDTFQVWVPYGSGYIASYPFIVTDINNPCLLDNVAEFAIQEKSSFKLYDLLGRVVDKITPNQMFLKVYDSGQIEKIMMIK
jgi:hypothetical protein